MELEQPLLLIYKIKLPINDKTIVDVVRNRDFCQATVMVGEDINIAGRNKKDISI